MYSFSKVLFSVIGATVFSILPSVAYSREPGVARLSKNSNIGCEKAINSVKTTLVRRGYFIPWQGRGGSRVGTIKPKLLRDKNSIQDNYYDYPADRTEAVVFELSGDMDKLYRGLMSSPQFMAILSAQIMSECDQVGLVEFHHWWEGFVPVGYFPDNTARTFTPVEFSSDSPYQKSIETSNGSRAMYQWGYYFSP